MTKSAKEARSKPSYGGVNLLSAEEQDFMQLRAAPGLRHILFRSDRPVRAQYKAELVHTGSSWSR